MTQRDWGWRVGGRLKKEGMCIHIADSCWCTAGLTQPCKAALLQSQKNLNEKTMMMKNNINVVFENPRGKNRFRILRYSRKILSILYKHLTLPPAKKG